MEVVVSLLLGDDLLVRLWNNSDQEVQEDDQVNELISEPHQPNQVYHCVLLEDDSAWVLAFYWIPVLVVWSVNVSDGVPVALDHEFDERVDEWITELITGIRILLDLNFKQLIADCPQANPHQKVDCEWDDFIHCHENHLNQEPVRFIDSNEVLNFDETFKD